MQCKRGDVVCLALRYINIKFCTYCRRKSYAQVSMDIALMVVNAAHMTRVLRDDHDDGLRTVKISLISVSIALEILIAVLLFFKERYDIDDERQHKVMNILNDIVIYVIFASVLVHVFVSVFVDDHTPAHYRTFSNSTSCS